MTKEKEPGNVIFGCLSVIGIIVLLFIAFGCTHSKKTFETRNLKDSTNETTMEDSLQLMKSELNRLQQLLEQQQYLSVQFDSTRCPKIVFPVGTAMLNKDSIQQLVNELNNAIDGLQNRLEVNSDGSVIAEGRLKEAKYSNRKLLKALSEWEKKYDSLSKTKKQEKQQVITETVVKTEKSKTSFMNFWWLFFLGIPVGALLVLKFKK